MLSGRRELLAVLAFAAWTLLVWATRLDNIWSEDDLDLAGQVARSALAVSFVGLAVGVLLVAWRRRERLGLALRLAVLWTAVVWVPRVVLILGRDHSVAFKAVHTLLAVMSLALGAAAIVAGRTEVSVGDGGSSGSS